ncbi:DUF262 domain-containing protein [Deinococcus arenicola]|uniref:DUF262 domain-containing protein n=1 Tax=Deinococcus arenicola TaxID=2994950 RepID=A0ABU4DNY2_9DEIO|nr:DUF262 domain-containing protein [Deinococcus sp. ZS9-10]MDV6373399.1 DUF262 domain-containing protein [Deinococcus sp. ZS9-10]
MEARPRVLTELLNGNQQFEIPLYQRRYSWGNSERAQFWADILKASGLTGNRFHFLGPVVFTKPESGMGGVVLTRARLIDGQQRLTTLTLLMQAVAEQLRDDVIQLQIPGSNDMQAVDASAIREDYLLNKRLTGDSRYKLLPTLADRDTLKHILTGEPLPERHSKELLAGIQFFRDRLADVGVTVEKVLTGLNRLEVVEVTLNDGRDDPQLIFESLNSTGKDLTPADLIRNNVLIGLKAGEQDELTRTYWLPIEAMFEEDGPEVFNRFMRDFLTVRMRTLVDKEKVYESFKAYREGLGDQAVQALVSDIYDMAKLYAQMLHPQQVKGQPQLRLSLQDLLGVRVRVTSPLLLELLEDHAKGAVTTDDLVLALRAIESFLVRRAVSEFRSAPLNKLFASTGRELVRDQGSAAYLRSVERALMRFQDRNRGGFPPDDVFTEKLHTVNLYTLDVCKHVLVRLERAMSPKELMVNDDLTIEHVMPQNRNLSEPWREMLGADWAEAQQRLVDTLGNLTLTGYNSELGDRPFDAKKTLPIKDGDTATSNLPKGYTFSRLLMTQQIAQETHWDEQSIQSRAERLAQLALKLWPLPAFTPAELDALRTERRRPAARDPWARLMALPTALAEVATAFDGRALELPGVNRMVMGREVSYRKGRRYALTLSTDDSSVNVWALLGESPDDRPGWHKGQEKGWWKRPVADLDELDTVWPLLLTAWARLPEVGTAPTPTPSLREAIDALGDGPRAAFETFEQALLQISPTLERNVTQFYFGYGQPVEFIGYLRDGHMVIEVRPLDPDILSGTLFEGWEPRSKERRVLHLRSTDDVVRALPLIRAVHDQFVQEIPYRAPQVRQFMRGLRAAFQEMAGDSTVQATKTAERYVVGGRDIGRVYINVENVHLLLRHPFAALDNPTDVGGSKIDDPIAGWPVGHFVGTFTGPGDLHDLRPLIEQVVQANRA